jgi:hypothetical protein
MGMDLLDIYHFNGTELRKQNQHLVEYLLSSQTQGKAPI